MSSTSTSMSTSMSTSTETIESVVSRPTSLAALFSLAPHRPSVRIPTPYGSDLKHEEQTNINTNTNIHTHTHTNTHLLIEKNNRGSNLIHNNNKNNTKNNMNNKNDDNAAYDNKNNKIASANRYETIISKNIMEQLSTNKNTPEQQSEGDKSNTMGGWKDKDEEKEKHSGSTNQSRNMQKQREHQRRQLRQSDNSIYTEKTWTEGTGTSERIEKEQRADKQQQEHTMDSIDNHDHSDNASCNQNSYGSDERHPLQSDWQFWFDRRNTRPGSRWDSGLRAAGNFNTIESFWGFWHHMQLPSQLELNDTISLFRKGIKPMWEDRTNAQGGKWTVHLPLPSSQAIPFDLESDHSHFSVEELENERDVQQPRSLLDRLWMNMCIALISEMLDKSGRDVAGIVCSKRRKEDRLEIWVTSKDDETAVVALGHKIREALLEELDTFADSGGEAASFGSKLQLDFQTHKDALKNIKKPSFVILPPSLEEAREAIERHTGSMLANEYLR